MTRRRRSGARRKHYTLKLLYQTDNPVQVKMFQTIQYELSQVGITV